MEIEILRLNIKDKLADEIILKTRLNPEGIEYICKTNIIELEKTTDKLLKTMKEYIKLVNTNKTPLC